MAGGSISNMGSIVGDPATGVGLGNVNGIAGVGAAPIEVSSDISMNANSIAPQSIVDISGSLGVAGQYLTSSSTGSRLKWADIPAATTLEVSGNYVVAQPSGSLADIRDITTVSDLNFKTTKLSYNGLAKTTIDGDLSINAGATERILLTSSGTASFDSFVQAGGNVSASGDVIAASTSAAPISLRSFYYQARGGDRTDIFVSDTSGDDISGTGSILYPFKTVQKAITVGESFSSAAQIAVINLASGRYTENLIFNKGYVVINGSLQTQTSNQVCEIRGNIDISAAGAADLFGRQISFQGVNIVCLSGEQITDKSTTSHTVAFQDCKISGVNRVFYGNSTGADARTYFTNCEILSTSTVNTDPVVEVARGALELERVDITADGNCNALRISGNAVVFRCSLSTFESTTASTTAAPIVRISTSSTSPQPFGNCALSYTNAASKAASPSSAGFYIDSGVASSLILLGNVFTMTGCTGSANNCVAYNGVGSPSVLLNNNTSLYIPTLAPNTFSIAAGISKVNYQNINGPATGSYSSSATQAIAVAGTPQVLTYNTTELQFNTTLVATSRIYTTATGTHRFDYSIQLENTSGGDQTATIWVAKNGTNVPRSASQVVVPNNGQTFPACHYMLQLNAGDYVEVYWRATSTNVRALAVPAVVGPPAIPAVPSIIANLQQVSGL